MKNYLKFGLVMAMLFGMALSTFANTADFSLRVEATMGKTVHFSLFDARNVKLSLFSSTDELLFAEQVDSKAPVRRKYDLNEFPDGTYTLEAESSYKISRYDIKVANGIASISEAAKSEVRKPMLFKKDRQRVSLSIINVEKTPIEIAIYDENGSELYSEKIPATVSLVKMFNFKEVFKGTYTFVTRYSNKTFTDSVTAGN